jgi:hypothetical protein
VAPNKLKMLFAANILYDLGGRGEDLLQFTYRDFVGKTT